MNRNEYSMKLQKFTSSNGTLRLKDDSNFLMNQTNDTCVNSKMKPIPSAWLIHIWNGWISLRFSFNIRSEIKPQFGFEVVISNINEILLFFILQPLYHKIKYFSHCTHTFCNGNTWLPSLFPLCFHTKPTHFRMIVSTFRNTTPIVINVCQTHTHSLLIYKSFAFMPEIIYETCIF